MQDCAPFQQKLHKNLVYLATVADSQGSGMGLGPSSSPGSAAHAPPPSSQGNQCISMVVVLLVEAECRQNRFNSWTAVRFHLEAERYFSLVWSLSRISMNLSVSIFLSQRTHDAITTSKHWLQPIKIVTSPLMLLRSPSLLPYTGTVSYDISTTT